MNRFLLSLTATFFAASLTAQTNAVDCIVLVRCATTEIVPEVEVLDGVLSAPALMQRLEAALGGPTRDAKLGCSRVLAQPSGLLVWISGEITFQKEWSVDTKDRATAAIASHLQIELDRLLFAEPRARLREREITIVDGLAKASMERRERLVRSAAVERQLALVSRQQEALEQQLTAARVDLATEESAAAHLERLQAQHVKLRDERREHFAGIELRRSTFETQIQVLRSRLDEERSVAGDGKNGAQLEILRTQSVKLDNELQALRASLERAQEQVQEAQRVLTVVLEHVPVNAIARERARARLQSLAEEQRGCEERRARADVEAQKATAEASGAERLGVEIATLETQLAAVRGKVLQLEPVRCEVVGSR